MCNACEFQVLLGQRKGGEYKRLRQEGPARRRHLTLGDAKIRSRPSPAPTSAASTSCSRWHATGEPANLVVSTGKAGRDQGGTRPVAEHDLGRNAPKGTRGERAGARFRAELPRLRRCRLDGMAETPQLSCPSPHDLHAPVSDGRPVTEIERGYRLCDQCGMYSNPGSSRSSISIFSSSSTVGGRAPRGDVRVHARRGLKMFFGNLIRFGVPGFDPVVPVLRGQALAAVSRPHSCQPQASRGDLTTRSGPIRKSSRRPVSAGVKHNIGMALLRQNRAEAARMFESPWPTPTISRPRRRWPPAMSSLAKARSSPS